MITHIAVVGSVGIPAKYGGFETLVENLARYHQEHSLQGHLTVFCSSRYYPDKRSNYLGASLRFVNLKGNGISSILYDCIALFLAVRQKSSVILLLGVSGAFFLPFVRVISSCKIATNIDGIEWKRDKWGWGAKLFLRLSEKFAVKYSDVVIADNLGISNHVYDAYGRNCEVIAYGGDHASIRPEDIVPYNYQLPKNYTLAVCRIEPENNVETILEAFSKQKDIPLVFVGNWENSEFGVIQKQKYEQFNNLFLIDAVYDYSILYNIRSNALNYVHGHSAGGTNPSLVEMMHFCIPILAFDCDFNRFTTENKALYFSDSVDLAQKLQAVEFQKDGVVASAMYEIACRRYTWEAIGTSYFDLLFSLADGN